MESNLVFESHGPVFIGQRGCGRGIVDG